MPVDLIANDDRDMTLPSHEPALRVVERFVVGKHGDPDRCEDLILVSGRFGAVLDGATDNHAVTFNGVAPGRFAVQVCAETIAALPDSIDARAAVDRLTAALGRTAAVARRDGPADALKPARPALSMIVYSAVRHEIWRVGDCAFLIDGDGDNPESLIDLAAIGARSAYLHSLLAAGVSRDALLDDDPGRALIAPLLRAQRALGNRDDDNPYAFGCIDGTPVPDRFLDVIAVPVEADEVVLASDGYPELRPTLAESERLLADILAEDPLCISRNPATKGLGPGQVSFDDRAYLRLAVRPPPSAGNVVPLSRHRGAV